MVRETRGSATKDAPGVGPPSACSLRPRSDEPDSASTNKRKRRSSDLPSATSDSSSTAANVPSLKVVLPSPSSVGAAGKTTTIHISPSKLANGAPNGASEGVEGVSGESSAKKQRISLKISAGKPNGRSARTRSKSKTPGLDEVGEGEGAMEVEDAAPPNVGDVKVEEGKVAKGRLVAGDMRRSLENVISKMTATLPPPGNQLLRTPLPPDSTGSHGDKTLEAVLRNEQLTWEHLISTLHSLSAHMLAPSRYPNPLPSVAQLNVPLPPLPSSLNPFPLYSFFDSLRSILISIQPPAVIGEDNVPIERWALLQKGVNHGPAGAVPVEWWSSLLNLREAEKVLDQLQADDKDIGEGGLMGHLAGVGGMFGNAIPVVMHDTVAGPSQVKVPKLNDAVIRKASHKAAVWKETLAKRRKGGFGSVQAPVHALKRSENDFSWTPTFGPSYDSLYASGGAGFYSTWDAMHQKAIHHDWQNRAFEVEETDRGWQGTLPARLSNGESTEKHLAKEKSVDDVLRDTGAQLEELEAWQLARLKRGVADDIGDRELAVASQVLDSLTSLASSTSPSSLLTAEKEPGQAHIWSQRFLATSSPNVRGLLDPRRPRGIKDNSTARFNARPLQPLQTPPVGPPTTAMLGSGGPRAYGPGTPGYSQSTPQGGYRRPVGRPPSSANNPAYYAAQSPSNPFSRPPAGSSGGAGYYGSPSVSGNTIYNRSPTANVPGGGAPQTTTTPLNYAALPGGPQQALNSFATRPGPGPSALRQSFGPGPGAGAGQTPGQMPMQAGRAYAQGGGAGFGGIGLGMGLGGRMQMTPTQR